MKKYSINFIAVATLIIAPTIFALTPNQARNAASQVLRDIQSTHTASLTEGNLFTVPRNFSAWKIQLFG